MPNIYNVLPCLRSSKTATPLPPGQLKIKNPITSQQQSNTPLLHLSIILSLFSSHIIKARDMPTIITNAIFDLRAQARLVQTLAIHSHTTSLTNALPNAHMSTKIRIHHHLRICEIRACIESSSSSPSLLRTATVNADAVLVELAHTVFDIRMEADGRGVLVQNIEGWVVDGLAAVVAVAVLEAAGLAVRTFLLDNAVGWGGCGRFAPVS
ncbi:hypothetical protein M430DRAFT_151026 [Amorphotheca resinae ATCC 22711]|uniref:Uncharacterized protein n=1 Tax=Amorphotheca resinae ATCC 22711 TaxID=857342 RepID=A0A2T3BCT5_AMORE|nr:hypothetical protein M430DRAFT_151026 [Amorphotheca resinae ATCC 22711]PSS27206.1 hypothetical protein M430DRAFT_151026 [Amorphotheca resinae ATCC 22711]